MPKKIKNFDKINGTHEEQYKTSETALVSWTGLLNDTLLKKLQLGFNLLNK